MTSNTLQQWRADTPAAEAGRVHLNNAGAALMPRPVVAAIVDHIKREAAMGGYEAGDAMRADIDAVYPAVAGLLDTEARNIAVVENATVAVAQALSAFDFQRDDVILTTRCDYVSNQLMYLSLASRCGVRLERAGVSTARFWMAIQSSYELAQAMRRKQPPVKPLKAA